MANTCLIHDCLACAKRLLDRRRERQDGGGLGASAGVWPAPIDAVPGPLTGLHQTEHSSSCAVHPPVPCPRTTHLTWTAHHNHHHLSPLWCLFFSHLLPPTFPTNPLYLAVRFSFIFLLCAVLPVAFACSSRPRGLAFLCALASDRTWLACLLCIIPRLRVASHCCEHCLCPHLIFRHSMQSLSLP